MSPGYPELVVDGVFVAPFVTCALATFAIMVALRPLLRRVAPGRLFVSQPLAELCLAVQILAILLVLF